MAHPTCSRTVRPASKRITRGGGSHPEIERFESVLGELSAAMARAPAHEVDREIEHWLGRICEALDLDRSAIYERSAPGQKFYITHTWARKGLPPFPPNTVPEDVARVTAARVMAGETLTFSRLSDIPPDMKDLRRWVAVNGPRASAMVPMRAGDIVFGGATFGKFRASRRWPSQLVKRLCLVAEVFGSAIQRRRLETRLQESRAELRVTSRRTVMGEFAASIAHELNQPLGAVLSNLEGARRLVSSKETNNARVMEALDDAVKDVKRAAAVVRRVRALFSGEKNSMSAINTATIVEEAAALVRSEAALRRITLQVETARDLPPIMGDRTQLQQCILNLLLNAFESVSATDSDRREVVLRAVRDGPKWVCLSVNDSGSGIDAAIAERLFEPFVTTKPKGMGMGLSVVRSIVENHGGRISATPNAAAGATFSFTLPVARKRQSEKSRPRQ